MSRNKNDNKTTPCGEKHPLACGLDSQCEMPVKYFKATIRDKTIWEKYQCDMD